MSIGRFEALARFLATAPSRRAVSRTIAALSAGSLLAPLLSLAGAESKKKRKRKKKKKVKCKPLAELFCGIPSPRGSCCDALTEDCTSCGCCPEDQTKCCIGGSKKSCCEPNGQCCSGACCHPGTRCCYDSGTYRCIGQDECCPGDCPGGTKCCKVSGGKAHCCPTEMKCCNADDACVEQDECCPSDNDPSCCPPNTTPCGDSCCSADRYCCGTKCCPHEASTCEPGNGDDPPACCLPGNKPCHGTCCTDSPQVLCCDKYNGQTYCYAAHAGCPA